MNNRIQQSAQCCVHCGKSYKKRENLDKHILLCDLLNNKSKKMVLEEDELVIPSAKNMYLMLIELGKKYNSLEEKMNEMSKYTIKKKNKVDVLEWLNTNIVPKIVFESLVSLFIVTEQDANSILDNSFYDVFQQILLRSQFVSLEDKPIFASNNEKANTIYIYTNDSWILASREKLTWLFNKIHMKLVDVFYSWKKVKVLEVGLNKDKFETTCDKATIKLMNIDFSVESIYSKTKGILFHSTFSTFEKVEPNPPL
jgi:hypothetical protein